MLPRAARPAHCLALLITALYSTVLLVSAFEHHDLACELKTPQHCTACVSSAVGADPAPATAGVWHLPDAGRTVAVDIRIETLLLDVDRTGRSPPAGPTITYNQM